MDRAFASPAYNITIYVKQRKQTIYSLTVDVDAPCVLTKTAKLVRCDDEHFVKFNESSFVVVKPSSDHNALKKNLITFIKSNNIYLSVCQKTHLVCLEF